MSIPPGSLRIDYNFSDTACYSGSGSTIFNLAAFPLLKASTNGVFVSQGNSSHFKFNGTNQKIQTEFFNTVNATTFTFNIWVQDSGSNAANGRIINYSGPYGFYLNANQTNLYSYVMTGPSYSPTLTNQNTANTWTLYTCTSDATTGKLYKNGVLISSGAFAGALPSGENLLVLASQEAQFWAKCKIARFQYYTAALDDADILQYFNDTKLYFPLNRYDFSETQTYPGTGNTAFDMAGTLDLYIGGAATPAYVGAGTSSYFEFSNGYIGKNGVTGLGSTFTISTWSMVAPGYISDGTVFAAGKQITAKNPQINYNNLVDNAINFNFQNTTGITSPFIGGQWQNITVTADGTNSKLYVDGLLASSNSQAGSAWTSGGFVLGKAADSDGDPQGNSFEGKIALLRVYNSSIGSTDVLALYNLDTSRFPPPPPYAGSVGGRQFAQGFHSA